MPKNVQLPDGSVVEFPDGMSDDAIGGAIKQHLASTPTPPVDMSKVAGAPSTGLPQPPTQQPANMQPSLLGRDTNPGPVANFAKGAVKGALKTVSSADDLAGKYLPPVMTTPIGQSPTPENSARAIQTAKNLAIPHGTAQKIGMGTEQAAEFLAPTGIEEGAAKLGGAALGKAGGLFGRVAGSAVHSGAINATQGGSFGGGAAAGAAGSLFGAGLQKVAPMLAETALGVRAGDRAYGRTPGQAILSETTGIKPGVIADQATQKVGQLNNELQGAAAASPMTASLAPARQVVDDAYNNALVENEDQTIKGIGKLQNQLHQWSGQPGAANIAPIPQNVTPSQLLSLKRGVGSFKGSFNPATTPDSVSAAAGRAYHALDTELDRTVPEAAGINQRISTLLPVSQRAGAADLNAGTVQRMVGRLKSHTGALIAPLTAASVGAAQHGPLGGLIGGTAGLFGQEVLASPTVQMGAARLANSPLTQKAIPGFVGAGLQVPKKKGLFQ